MARGQANLALIGMPGSGKSSVGRALAALLGRKFVDLDDWAAEREGRSIARIFAEDGEGYFRDLEAAGIRAIPPQSGLVVATGGGCILRGENVRTLRQGGLTILLDRAPDRLEPSDERPLADTRERVERLYCERRALYLAAADVIVDYYAPAELPDPVARVARHIADLLQIGGAGEARL